MGWGRGGKLDFASFLKRRELRGYVLAASVPGAVLTTARASLWHQNELSTLGLKPGVDNYREAIRFL